MIKNDFDGYLPSRCEATRQLQRQRKTWKQLGKLMSRCRTLEQKFLGKQRPVLEIVA